jgi:hypothetical protein
MALLASNDSIAPIPPEHCFNWWQIVSQTRIAYSFAGFFTLRRCQLGLPQSESQRKMGVWDWTSAPIWNKLHRLYQLGQLP